MNFIKARIEKMSNTELVGEFVFFESMVTERLNISRTHSISEIIEEEYMFIKEISKRFGLDDTLLLELLIDACM